VAVCLTFLVNNEHFSLDALGNEFPSSKNGTCMNAPQDEAPFCRLPFMNLTVFHQVSLNAKSDILISFDRSIGCKICQISGMAK
jgi:hypothetical protein